MRSDDWRGALCPVMGLLLLWVSVEGSHLVTEKLVASSSDMGWIMPRRLCFAGLIQEVHRWPLLVSTVCLLFVLLSMLCSFGLLLLLLCMFSIEWCLLPRRFTKPLCLSTFELLRSGSGQTAAVPRRDSEQREVWLSTHQGAPHVRVQACSQGCSLPVPAPENGARI